VLCQMRPMAFLQVNDHSDLFARSRFFSPFFARQTLCQDCPRMKIGGGNDLVLSIPGLLGYAS